ncbi:MAG: ATP-binding protein [Bdellovibrionales bacterium]
MKARPYFSISKHSFEKNAGYKTTVHALAELIDNSFEATATKIAIVLMVDRENRLQKIGVLDNGNGMEPTILQAAVCEKSGEYLNRQYSKGTPSRRKLGKYGVGLPKASISQCNKFSVWSWTSKGFGNAYGNLVNIEDHDWIEKGANVLPSWKESPDGKWLKAADLEKEPHGTFILWEALDGITWSRARWGERSGLIPNLEFHVGRIYRKMLGGKKPELTISVFVINESFKEIEKVNITPNDPLYIIPGCNIPKKEVEDGTLWPPDDPLFEDITGNDNGIDLKIKLPDNTTSKVRVTYRRSVAKKNTNATLNGVKAGKLPHGEHAARNTGLSIMREGREVELSLALVEHNKPQERWFGVEFDIPQELDAILGMTNNKQGYTRLDQVLRQSQSDYKEDKESTDECIRRLHTEDPHLAVCLELAWLMQKVWDDTKDEHEKSRVIEVDTREPGSKTKKGESPTPESTAENVATKADKSTKGEASTSDTDKEKRRKELIEDLITVGGVPQRDAEQLAARIVERGLSYAIVSKSGLGSSFFNVRSVVDAKIIELNKDHPVYPMLLSSIGDEAVDNVDELKQRLKETKTTIMLMLEAWAKVETQTQSDSEEKRRLHRMREDWGRCLEDFLGQMESESKS